MTQGYHNNTHHHSQDSVRDQHRQRRTSNNGSSGNNRHHQWPRSRHNSGHSSSQRDRTHSNSSNTNIHVAELAPHYASKFSTSNVVITNTPHSSMSLGVTNGMSGVVASSSIVSSSTTTTFYSGVKLAPPVQSASVEKLERRSNDQKVWYTIQVFPCHLVIPGNGGTIPRKPYRIYRRYEDVTDFADQLEEEFPALIPRVTSPGAPSSSFAMEDAQESALCSVSGSASILSSASVSPSPLYQTSAAMTNSNHNNHSASTYHDPSDSTAAFTDKGVASLVHVHVPCTLTPGCATTPNAPTTAAPSKTLPRLKSRLVLYVTKAACVQRKDELDRYLKDLFALGPIIAQSRLVAEFFGIWKTDMEMHLSHENRDPLALHTGASLSSPISASLSPDATLAPPLPDLHHGTPEPFSPSSPSDILMHHSFNNDTVPTDDTTMDFASPSAPKYISPSLPPSTHLASPSLSPSPNPEPLRVLIAPIVEDLGHVSDVEMASPTKPSPSQREIVDGHESETGIEIEPNTAATSDSVTTRTIRKFRSLRRPSATPINQQRPTESEALAQDGKQSTPKTHQVSETPAVTSATVPTQVPNTKPKIMKRAKTIVFRPEVTMQPLSSKHVIPPWNRIPSTMAPISPVSPTSPSLSPRNDGLSEPFDSTFSNYNEERPRKLSMTQSKTMPSIPTQPASFPSASGNSGGAPSTISSSSSGVTYPSGLSTSSGLSTGGFAMTRGGSISSQGSSSSSITPLIAPWNRVNSKSEINTHLHSLIKISGQPTPSLQNPAVNSPFIPIEVSKSVKKKQLQSVPTMPQGRGMTKSVTVPANLKDYQDQNQEFSQQVQKLRGNPVPVLNQPPQTRSRTTSGSRIRNGSGTAMTRNQLAADTNVPQGVVPIMTISAPEPSRPQPSGEQDNAVPSDSIRKKRAPRRESGSLHSPSMSTKQPVSILKNSGTRKASLTVPSSMFSPAPSPDTPRTGSRARSTSASVATTFKIVMDADTIVALQVVEDPREFLLTLVELRTRVEAKLLKSNIQLPAAFDLVWKSSASTSDSSVASAPESLPAPAAPLTSMSTPLPGQGLLLKTDQDLQQAIQGSKNRKVTLRCAL
ncbi:hypothetical protein CPC16_007174 [Podila verticillata]|nr:hypothetical protein CPC16_007174 [Podila verticillata]